MSLPVVAIVGRPNVGKSSLLAFLTRQLVSIVDPTAGVTRDRVTAVCAINDFYFELVDTGGYGIDDADDLTDHVERQIGYALAEADLILFVCDVRDGILPLDQAVAKLLRPHADRVICVVNKVDGPKMEPDAGEFASLGYGEPILTSATHYAGRADLESAIVDRLGGRPSERPADPVMRFAIVGCRNAGKSTFINALAGEERVIVSEVPGTTRDAVDVRFELDGKTYLAIDTAGVRKKARMQTAVEYLGYHRVTQSVTRADVALLMIDATRPVGEVDKKLAGLLVEECKPTVIVINKWDLAKGRAATEDYGDYLTKILPQLDFAPVAFTSAKDGHNVTAAVETAWSLFRQANLRVGTGQLNAALREVMELRGPSPKRGRRPPKLYYGTQVSALPPTIVLFVNDPSLVAQNYQRFLINRLRERLPFEEIPIRLIFRSRRGRSAPP